MTVIRTKRNIVCALDPLPGDTFVQTLLGTPSGQRVLSTHPIADYDASVSWAVNMADQMAHAITIMPITTQEYLAANRGRLARGLAALSDQERNGLRQVAIASMQQIAQGSHDPKVRADALTVLHDMRVLQ